VPLGFTPSGIDVSTTASTVYIGAPGGVNILDLGSNIPPVANAGPDQIVDEGDTVQLDGSGSSDFDMDPLTFQWTQTRGATVVLSSSSAVESPTFTAPDVSGNTIFEFSLTVNDGLFDSIADLVTIVVKDVTTFVVTLSSVGGQLEGDVTIDDFPTDTQLTFDFVNPVGDAEGKLEDVKIASSISGSNVEFEFIANIEEPDTVPPLNDPALYYEISNTVIDFSGTSNFPSNYLPSSQFLIDKNYDASGSFSDGCPVVFSLLLNEVSNQWETQGDPQIANTNKIYVVDSVGDQVFVVDGKTNEIITSISVGDNPRDSVFDPTLNKLYVTNLDSGTVSVINTLTNTVQATIPVIGAAAIDIDTATNKVYAANFGLGTIKVIDTNTDTIVDTIITSGTNLSAMAFSPNLQRLFIVDSNSNELITVDTVTKTEISSIAMGGIPTGMAINPNNDSVYIALASTSEVLVVNGATNTIIENIPVGVQPVGVGVNSLTNKVFVSNLGSGTVSVIDSAINVEIDTITLAAFVVGLAVNENTDRVLVANIATGTVSILDGSTHELLDTVTLAPNIFTVTLNNLVSNPERDPSNDNRDSMTDEILECAYIAKLPHLSKFAIGGVKALALGGVGGGGSSPTTSLNNLLTSRVIDVPEEVQQMVVNHDSYTPLEPMDPDSFEGFDLPLVINDQGFVLGGFTNTLQTSTIKTDTPVTMTFTVYTTDKVQHFSLYTNLRDTDDSIPKSDTQILYNDGKDLQVIDPNGFFSDAKITVTEEEDSVKKQPHYYTNVGFKTSFR
jgi:YVTN family beta-propeller protein